MFISLLVLFVGLSTINAQYECSDRSAICINIHNCSEITTILRNAARPLSPQVQQILRELHCGFEGNVPKVCCKQQQVTHTMTPTTTETMPISMPMPTPMPTPTPTPIPILTPTPIPTPTTTTTMTPTSTTTTTMMSTMTTTTTMMATMTITTIAAPNSEDITDPPDVTNHPNLHLLDHQNCGHFFADGLFGNKARIFQYPWMALIAYESDIPLNPQFLCSGTVISSRYILTAAHCVTSLPETLRLKGVRVGDHDISTEHDCEYFNGLKDICAEKYQDFGVDNFYFHPGYTTTELKNDIGLIRLNDSIDFSPENVKPICLPLSTAAKVNIRRALVTGWHLADGRNTYLQQERQLVVSNEQCKEIYNQSKYQIWYKQLCAGGRINDTCLGDGGSPLQMPGTYGTSVRMIQQGIVSYGATSCGVAGIPDVYTRVAYYMDWILNTMTD